MTFYPKLIFVSEASFDLVELRREPLLRGKAQYTTVDLLIRIDCFVKRKIIVSL
jgi:hypothetical protein